MKNFISIFSVIILAILSSGLARGQVMLQKAVISSGGGTVSNSTSQAGVTVAQPATGVASNSQMRGEIGFWTSESAASSVAQSVSVQVGIDVWPNPASGVATANITLANASNLDVELYDINGKEVKSIFSGNAPSGTSPMEIDLSDLASGSYILAARIPGQIIESRISVVR